MSVKLGHYPASEVAPFTTAQCLWCCRYTHIHTCSSVSPLHSHVNLSLLPCSEGERGSGLFHHSITSSPQVSFSPRHKFLPNPEWQPFTYRIPVWMCRQNTVCTCQANPTSSNACLEMTLELDTSLSLFSNCYPFYFCREKKLFFFFFTFCKICEGLSLMQNWYDFSDFWCYACAKVLWTSTTIWGAEMA